MVFKSIKYKTRILEHYGIMQFGSISTIKYFGVRVMSDRRRVKVMYKFIEKQMWDLVKVKNDS